MMDINTFMEKYINEEVKRENYIVNFLGIIDPIPYDMSKNCIFFENFGIVWWSTDLRETENTIDYFKKSLEPLIATTCTMYLDGDDLLTKLHTFSKKTISVSDLPKMDIQTAINNFNECFNLFSQLLIFNIGIAKDGVYYFTAFESSFIGKEKRYWVYVGIKKRTEKEIIELSNKLLDSAQKKEGKKNAFFNVMVKTKVIDTKRENI